MIFTTTWKLSMTDLLLVGAIPVTIMLLAVAYQVVDYWFQKRDKCQHTWTRWSDLQKDGTHPYQTRSCSKCNLHEQTLIK